MRRSRAPLVILTGLLGCGGTVLVLSQPEGNAGDGASRQEQPAVEASSSEASSGALDTANVSDAGSAGNASNATVADDGASGANDTSDSSFDAGEASDDHFETGVSLAEGGGAPAPPACGDTNSDNKNCGNCGHDCLGGLCSAGACLPVTLYSTNGFPWGIAVDSARVYWTDNILGPVMSVPIGGGDATLLAMADRPTVIEVGAGTLVWMTQTEGLWRLQPGETTPTEIAITGGSFGLALSGTEAYWTDLGGSVARMPIAGGTIVPIATSQNVPLGIAVTQDSAYWLDLNDQGLTIGTTSLLEAPFDGETPTVVVPSVTGQPSGRDAIAIDSSNVYFTISDSLYSLALTGGQPKLLATGVAANAMAVDDSGIYVAVRSEILRVPLDGGIAEPLVEQLFDPEDIALDKVAVYFTDANVVMKIAK